MKGMSIGSESQDMRKSSMINCISELRIGTASLISDQSTRMLISTISMQEQDTGNSITENRMEPVTTMMEGIIKKDHTPNTLMEPYLGVLETSILNRVTKSTIAHWVVAQLITIVSMCILKSLNIQTSFIMVTTGWMELGMDTHTSPKKMVQHTCTSLTVALAIGN